MAEVVRLPPFSWPSGGGFPFCGGCIPIRPYITVADYAALTGLLRNAAAKELRRWAEDKSSGIGSSGRGTHKVHVRRDAGGEAGKNREKLKNPNRNATIR